MKSIKFFLVIFFSALVASCGGGGGSSGSPVVATTITGTAAIGLPIAGQVTAIDSTGKTFAATIGSQGAYTVNVTGGTPPFILIVSGTAGGTSVSLASVATAVGQTVNVTSLTDLIVSTAAGQPAGTVLASLCIPTVLPGCTAALIAATNGTNLSNAVTAVTNMVAPLNTANTNPLNGAFVANGTGMDAVLNAILVTQASGQGATATVTLVAVPTQQLGTVTMPSIAGGMAVAAPVVPPTATITAIAGIQATTKARDALFATSLPSATDPNLLALYSSTFLNNGETSSVLLTNNFTKYGSVLIGSKFTNAVVLDSIDTAGTIAKVHFTPIDMAGIILDPSNVGGVVHWKMKLNATTGLWQFDGNQRIAYVAVKTFALQSTCNPQTIPACTALTSYKTGLWLGIIDKNATLANATAVVTGPGLPATGVTLIPPTIAAKGFILSTANPNCVTGCSGTNVWFLSDPDITGLTSGIAAVTANSSYTVKLYDSTSALLATYTDVIPVATVLNTALQNLAYPTLSGLVNLAGIGAATLTPSWTIPTGLAGGGIQVDLYQTGTNQDARVTADTLTSSGTASISIPLPTNLGTWTSGGYGIYEWDQNAGFVFTNYQ